MTDQLNRENLTTNKQVASFALLSPDVMNDILCFLSFDDLSIKGFLKICKIISLNMLGISNLDDPELNMDLINVSPYYRTLTFLVMRRNIERFSLYANKREKFLKREGDYEKLDKKLRNIWNKKSTEEKNDLVSGVGGRKSNILRTRIQTQVGEFSSSKVFYRLSSTISDLNKLFPYWLTSKTEFNEMHLMKTYIEQHKNINNLYQTMFNLKMVGSPVILVRDDEVELHDTIDTQLNTILFENKRFSKSVNKQRNWKFIFEKQLERDIHLRMTESIFTIHKKCLVKKLGIRKIDLNMPIVFNTELTKIMKILDKVDEKTRLNYLFNTNYAHGKRSVGANKQNDSVRLLQNLLYIFNGVKKVSKTRNKVTNSKNAEVIIKFFHYTLDNWKIYYRTIHQEDTEPSDSVMIREFLLDGPRRKMKTLYLLNELHFLDMIIDEFRPVFEEQLPLILDKTMKIGSRVSKQCRQSIVRNTTTEESIVAVKSLLSKIKDQQSM